MILEIKRKRSAAQLFFDAFFMPHEPLAASVNSVAAGGVPWYKAAIICQKDHRQT
jgi:hypothetical protein